MTKFLSDALFKGSLTAGEGVILGAGKNISTTNQAYILATNYTNGIPFGWDVSGVFVGYSMSTLPIYLGTNGSGNFFVKTTGNTIIENGNLLVGTATNSGFRLDVNGQARFSDHVVINTDPAYFSGSGYNGYKVLGIGSTVGGGISFVSSNGVAAEVFGDNTATGLYLASYGAAPVITFWLNLTEVGKFLTTGDLQLTTLAGSGTRMVVADANGKLSVQAVPSFSESDTLDSVTDRGAITTNTISVGGIAVGQTSLETGTKLTVNGSVHFKNGYLYGKGSNDGDFGFYPESGYYELSAPAGPNQGVIFVLNGKHTGKQIGFYTGDTNYTGMLLYEQAPVGGDLAYWTTDKWAMTPNHNLVWAASTGLALAQGPYDIGLTREAAGVLQVNNGTIGTYANLKLAGLTASSLAGTGTRMVVANSSGQLSTQALPGGGTVTGTGTTNYVSKWTSSTALGNSTIFDDGNGVGIGTATLNAQTRLTVMGSQSYSKSIVLDSTWNYQTSWAMRNGIYSTEFNLGGSTKSSNEGGPGSLQISTYNSSTNTYRYPMTFFANANVSFGGTTGSVPADNGSTVQVVGSVQASTLVGTGTRMVVASAGGVLGVQAIPTGSLQGAVDADKNTSGSLAVGTTTVKSVSAATYSGVFFDYVVKNGTNVRVGSVVAITNGTNIEFYETLSNDIGTTTGLTFTVTLASGNMNLNAVAASTGFTVIVSTRAI